MWSGSHRPVRIETYDEDKPTDTIINVEASKINAKPNKDTIPALLEGGVILLGRDVLYRDTDVLKYPPNDYLYDAWGCYGKFTSKLVGKSYLPLCIPTKDEFDLKFDTENSYQKFLKKYKLQKPESEKPNPLVPSMFILPYSEEEFDEKNLSGDYKTISSMFNPGELVTHITKGPIYKPAKLFTISKDAKADIEYSEFDEKQGSTKIISSTVGAKEYVPLQLAGPSILVDRSKSTPHSMTDCSYDQEFFFYLAAEDIDPF